MSETLKAHQRRLRDGFYDRYTPPNSVGIDIGCGPNDTFWLMPPHPCRIVRWDKAVRPARCSAVGTEPFGEKPPLPSVDMSKFNGETDAHDLSVYLNSQFDFVYASHILEHLEDPSRAVKEWWRVLKPGGHLIISVPHRDLYEKKRRLPSRFNEDHKTFWLPHEFDPPNTFSLSFFLRDALGISIFCYFDMDIEVQQDGWSLLPPEQHSPGEFSIEAIIRKEPV